MSDRFAVPRRVLPSGSLGGAKPTEATLNHEPDVQAVGVVEGAADTLRPYLTEDALRDAERSSAGLSTGFVASLDVEGLRWAPGSLYLVAGGPGEGKTTFLLELLFRHVEARSRGVAADRGPAVFVSYQESRLAVFARLLQRASIHPDSPPGAPPRPIVEEWLRRGGEIDSSGARAAEWSDELSDAADRLDGHGRDGLLTIVDGDRYGRDLESLVNALESARRRAGVAPSLVVVDSAPEFWSSGERPSTGAFNRLARVAEHLRRFAKGHTEGEERPEFALPIILGAGVGGPAGGSGEVGSEVAAEATADIRTTRQPELHDLRGLGPLLDAASGVLTLHRPDRDDGQPLRVKVVKNRHGRAEATVDLGFYGSWSHVAGNPGA